MWKTKWKWALNSTSYIAFDLQPGFRVNGFSYMSEWIFLNGSRFNERRPSVEI